jgi:hypothetical protein
LSDQTVNLSVHRFGQHGRESVPTELAELVLEMLLRLGGDVPVPLLTLKGEYEFFGDGHCLTIGEIAV